MSTTKRRIYAYSKEYPDDHICHLRGVLPLFVMSLVFSFFLQPIYAQNSARGSNAMGNTSVASPGVSSEIGNDLEEKKEQNLSYVREDIDSISSWESFIKRGDFSSLENQLLKTNRHLFYYGVPLLYVFWNRLPFSFLGRLLKYPSFLEDRDSKGRNAIYYAIDLGNIEQIKFLLDAGFSLYSEDQEGNTPIHYAIIRSNHQLVETMLHYSFEVNHKNHKGMTALHLMAYRGFTQAIKMILSLGADVNVQDQDGITPLHYAAGNGHYFSLEALLEKKPDYLLLDREGNTVIFNAIASNKVEILKLILKHSPIDINYTGGEETPLEKIIDMNNANMLKVFLEYLDIEKTDSQEIHRRLRDAIFYTIQKGNVEMFQLLRKELHLEEIISTNECGENIFQQAILYHRDEFLELPLFQEHIPNLPLVEDCRGFVWIQELLYGGYIDIWKEILAKRKDIWDFEDKKGNNILHYLADAPIYMLQEVDLPLNMNLLSHKNHNKFTPIELAIEHKKDRVARILLSKTKAIERSTK